MKKYIIIPAAMAFVVCAALFLADLSAAKEETTAMESVIRLHVRAADNSDEEQALKLKVRDGILNYTCDLLADCTDKSEAKSIIESNLDRLEEVGQAVVNAEEKKHTVFVSLGRETFEYREYDGFFLPEGVYDSLIVNIGPGEGQNWWCVVFPAACYMGAAEVETDAEQMPSCFQLAKTREEDVKVEWWLWTKIKEWFS